MPKYEPTLQGCRKFLEKHPGIAQSDKCMKKFKKLYSQCFFDQDRREQFVNLCDELAEVCSRNKHHFLMTELGRMRPNEVILKDCFEIGDKSGRKSPAEARDVFINIRNVLKTDNDQNPDDRLQLLIHYIQLMIDKLETFIEFYFKYMDMLIPYLESIHKNFAKGFVWSKNHSLRKDITNYLKTVEVSLSQIKVDKLPEYTFPRNFLFSGEMPKKPPRKKVLAFLLSMKFIYDSGGDFYKLRRTQVYCAAIILGSKEEEEVFLPKCWDKFYQFAQLCLDEALATDSDEQDSTPKKPSSGPVSQTREIPNEQSSKPKKTSHRRVSQIRGIPNFGASCFANASIQQLYRDKNLVELVLSPELPTLGLPEIDINGDVAAQITQIEDPDMTRLVVLRILFWGLENDKINLLVDRNILGELVQFLGYDGHQLEADRVVMDMRLSCNNALRSLGKNMGYPENYGKHGDATIPLDYVQAGMVTVAQRLAVGIVSSIFSGGQLDYLNLNEIIGNDYDTVQSILDEFDRQNNMIKLHSPIISIVEKKQRANPPKFARRFGEDFDPHTLAQRPLDYRICHGNSLYVPYSAAGSGMKIEGDIMSVELGGGIFKLKSAVVNTNISGETFGESMIGSIGGGHYVTYTFDGDKCHEISDRCVEEVDLEEAIETIRKGCVSLQYGK